MEIPMYIVDAFTDKPFSGNPAAVCLIGPEQDISTETMQKLGAEMNLSETVFVIREKGTFETGDCFNIRWFTPTTEVNLCGHATLASAAVLFLKKGNKNKTICFKSRSGDLSVEQDEKGRISLNFPANPPVKKDPEEYRALLEKCVSDQSLIHSVHFSPTTGKLLVRLVDTFTRSELESLQPQVSGMVSAETTGQVKGVALTVRGGGGENYDFLSRYFAPWVGIAEDPVTGSWHTVAAVYWGQELSKSSLYARQCSPRGGDLWVDNLGERVRISGQAVVNLEGVFTV